ncbi:MAG: response regulator [Pseudomonadota bacterium]
MTALEVVQSRPITLLLVDDDDVDIMSICRALTAKGIENPLVVAHDGVEALECLRGENGRQRVEPPFIILLDLNMPRMDGIEFLGELRADPALQHSVVYVLTTSSAQNDRLKAHAHNVDGFITKGASQDVVNDVIDLLSL